MSVGREEGFEPALRLHLSEEFGTRSLEDYCQWFNSKYGKVEPHRPSLTRSSIETGCVLPER